jgi:hypothetical protein
MLSVVSLLYVLGILAKPNFKVYESKLICNNPSSLACSEFKVQVFGRTTLIELAVYKVKMFINNPLILKVYPL